MRILTIGHSTRAFEEFHALLAEHGVRLVADVRRFPSSRKFPQFNQGLLRELLDAQGIRYEWLEALGGRRHGAQNEESPNLGLKSPGFRNYADYMMTEPFHRAVDKLLSLGAQELTAIVCAEKLFWRCHRRLLSDFLVARGVAVEHILDPGRLLPHSLTPDAEVTEQGNVIYPKASSDAQGQFEWPDR
jgi:uncharacterized protein (DUF488 family)